MKRIEFVKVDGLDRVKKMAELEAEVEHINSFLQDENLKELEKSKEKAEGIANDINQWDRQDVYKEMLTKEYPMQELITMGEIPQLSVKYNKATKTNTECYTLKTDKMSLVNVREFSEYAKLENKSVYVNGQWIYKIEILTKYLNMRVMKDLENKQAYDDIKKSYVLSKEAKAMGFSEKNPTSNNSLKKACTDIVKGITTGINDFKSSDLNHLLLCMTGSSNRTITSVRNVREETVLNLLTREMYRLLNSTDKNPMHYTFEK